jgi:tRNA-modifying protein YgfZ
VTATIRHALLATLPSQARAVVRVTGDDSRRFLQGLLSADVGELTPGRATAATLLTVKGKIISEVLVLAVAEDEPWLALPAEIAQAVIAKLDAHIIMDDVELEPLPDHECAIAWTDAGTLTPDQLGSLPADVRAFTASHPLPGVVLVGSGSALAALDQTLDSIGELADADQFNAARIAHARPAWGFEIGEERFPPEVGFVDAVSYDKGCYLGQEPLSRIHNRGQVNRVMVRVTLSALPDSPLPLTLEVNDVVVGELTTHVPALDGLAIIRRVHAKPGAQLRAGELIVTVVSPPLGDDPGRAGRQGTAPMALGGRR